MKSVTSTKSIQSLVQDYNNKHICLDAIYQRDVVWDVNKKSCFIQSCNKGIIPNPLIFNNISSKAQNTCIDGKQRITSLYQFFSNQFPFEDEETGESYWYDEDKPIKKGKKDKANFLTAKQRNTFNMINIPIITYTDITYEQEIDIFSRIQNGIALSIGQVMISKIPDSEAAQKYKVFCDKHIKLLSSLCNTNVGHDDHYFFVGKLLCLLGESTVTDPSKKNVEAVLIKLKLGKKLDNSLSTIEKAITYLTSIENLNHKDITKDILKNSVIKMCLFRHVFNEDNYNASEKKSKRLRTMILSIYDKIQSKEITQKVKIKALFDNYAESDSESEASGSDSD